MGKKTKGEEGGELASAAENIKVIVRCRPLNSKELDEGYKSAVDLNLAEATVTVNHVCGNPDRWTFDGVVNNTFTQRDIFTQFIMPLVDSVMDGFNATVFAYGQSGSGKTHTMTGRYDDEEMMGIIPRTFNHVFNQIRTLHETHPNKHFTLYCSFVELYNGKVRDLLARQQVPLAVKENKDKTFFVQGSHIPQVKFPEDLTRWMEEGTERRQVASTELNADSSRSHSIFTLIVECTETSDDGDIRSVTSKFNLVDLAGSERQSKTGASGDTLKEGCNINLSLSALGTVIDTLVKGKGHVPFRSSPLTMLLKDSLGGSSKTVMFANIGPSEHNVSETVSTLRFADRAKQIKNKPVVNMDTKDQKIAELTEQVSELKAKLKQFESGGFAEMEEELNQLREKCGELEVDRDNAVKGRELDSADFTRLRQQLEADLEAAHAQRAELGDQVNRLTQELQFAEQMAQVEQKQRQEILAVCSSHFNAAVESVDELIRMLKSTSQGVDSAEHAKLKAEHNEVLAELKSARDKHTSEVTALQASLAQEEELLRQANKKLEKAKQTLDKEKQARKQMVLESSSVVIDSSGGGGVTTSPMRASFMGGVGHSMVVAPTAANETAWVMQKQEIEKRHREEIAELNAVVLRFQRDLENDCRTKELEEELRRVKEGKSKEVSCLLEELKLATSAATTPGGADSNAVAALKHLVGAKDEAYVHARDQIASLEKQVDELRRLRYERRPSLKEFAEERAHFEQVAHEALREELEVTAQHRDQLLDHIVESAGGVVAPDSLATQIEKLKEENNRLRAAVAKASDEQTALANHEATEARLRDQLFEMEAAVKTLRAKGAADEVLSKKDELAAELDQLRATMERMRSDFAEREGKLIDARAGVAGGDAEDDNPLSCVVDMLRSDKASLASEVARLSKEAQALRAELETARRAVESQGEVDRLHHLLSAPNGNDTEAVATLRAELRKRDAELTTLHCASPSPQAELVGAKSQSDVPLDIVEKLQDELSHAEAQLKQRTSLLEMEKAEITSELEILRQEFQDEQQRRSHSEQEQQRVAKELSHATEELSAALMRAAQLENKCEEAKAETTRIQSESQNFSSIVLQLEQRVEERTEQLKTLRATLESQKGVMERMKSKLETQQQNLNAVKQELALKDQAHSAALHEQEENIHKHMNKRIEQLAEEHQKAMMRKDEEAYALRKKIKKLENSLEKAKGKFDEKVCELEELRSRMEEQKLEQMKAMKDSHVVEIEEHQNAYQDALKRAKEDQKRKADLFTMGGETSALAQVRAAGNAAMLVAKAKAGPGTSRREMSGANTPPTQPATLPSRGNLYDF